jgi:suppressor of fused protein SUFU
VTSDSPGWDAIDARLNDLYPNVEPKHFGTLHRSALGGPDPLDGVSFYPRDEPSPHWHIVGYGLSELYAKETDNVDESGWGFEFTFRVARDGDDKPPMWAANLLQNLARYVFSSGNWFEPGHHMNANGPLREDYKTAMTALAFAEDPELGTIHTPNGKVQFLQVVGLTGSEYEAARGWDTQGVLDLIGERAPLLITDLDRASITDDPPAMATIAAGRDRDGSSTGLLMVSGLETTENDGEFRLRLKASTAAGVAQAVRDRLGHRRELILDGGDALVVLIPGEVFAGRVRHDGVREMDLPPEAVSALSEAHAPGAREIPGTRLVVEVVE